MRHGALPALLCSVLLTGCAMPGLTWKMTEYTGPLAFGGKRAEVLNKCDLGPAFMSDVVACSWAFVDHKGDKVNATDDVQSVLDDFMPSVDRLRPWVQVSTSSGSPASPSRQHVPYHLHLVTISPVALLVVPHQPGDDRSSCSRWPKDGCIPSRRFDLEPYWYQGEPRAVPGSFWVVPSLGITGQMINSVDSDVLLELPDSRIRLSPSQGVWRISREASRSRAVR